MSETINFMALAREVFSDMPPGEETDRFLDFVLWNYTGFPCFFAGDPLTICRQQLEEYRDDPDGVIARQEAEWDEIKREMESERKHEDK